MFYDPMIAKLVTHGPTRLAAIDAQAEALDAFVIDGIQPNIPFLTALMQHPRWRSGELSTGFIKEEYPDGFGGRALDDEARRVLAIAALSMEIVRKTRLDRFADRLKPHAGVWRSEWVVRLGREQIAATVPTGGASKGFSAEVDLGGRRSTVASSWTPGEGLWHGTIDGADVSVQVRPAAGGVTLPGAASSPTPAPCSPPRRASTR